MRARIAGREYATIAAVLLAVCAAGYAILMSALTGKFDELERAQVRSQANRVSSALAGAEGLVRQFTMTNAQWDQLWSSIVKRDRDAAVVEFPPGEMRSAYGVSGVVVLDRAGGVVGGGLIDGRGDRYLAPSESLGAVLQGSIAAMPGTACGVMAAVEAHYLFCAASVVHTDGSGPAVGRLVVLRALDAAGVSVLGRAAGLPMRVVGDRVSGGTALASAVGTLRVLTDPLSGKTMDLLVEVPAVQGGRPLVVKTTLPRSIHAAAVQSAWRSAEVMALVGLVTLLVAIVVLRATHARRTRIFQRAVWAAAEGGGHVTAPARELDVLAWSVNDLLDAVSSRQREIEREREAAREALDRDRERLEIERRVSYRLEAVGQLAAGLAHEINTPLQFVGDSVSFLGEAVEDLLALTGQYREALFSEQPIPVEERRVRMREAEQAADVEYLLERIPPALGRTAEGIARVRSIVQAMKQFSNTGEAEAAPADLNEALATTLTVSHNEYKDVADVELIEGPLPLVTCSVAELNQVFLNLVLNATQAIAGQRQDGGRRGRIEIETSHEDDEVVVRISDDGQGIPYELQDRIYDPFFTTKEVGRGTGHGLALARSIVLRHGGTITCVSEPGRGATFTIRLPLFPTTAPMSLAIDSLS